MTQIFEIKSLKYNKKVHRRWKGQLLEETSDYWLFYGEFENDINHSELGLIRAGTMSYEYFFKTYWFNVFRFHEPNGQFKFYYCNLSFPPIFEDKVLSYIDLDIDVLVNKDFSYQVLDLEEYQENASVFPYPMNIQVKIQQQLEVLLEAIEQQKFPFSKVLQQT